MCMTVLTCQDAAAGVDILLSCPRIRKESLVTKDPEYYFHNEVGYIHAVFKYRGTVARPDKLCLIQYQRRYINILSNRMNSYL
jgi:hypothetical protein